MLQREGGVFVAVQSDIKCEEVRIPEMNDLESVCVKIQTRTGFVYIYCLYIRYGSSIEYFGNIIIEENVIR